MIAVRARGAGQCHRLALRRAPLPQLPGDRTCTADLDHEIIRFGDRLFRVGMQGEALTYLRLLCLTVYLMVERLLFRLGRPKDALQI